MIEVRRGELSDIPWLCQELEKFSKFFGSTIPLYDDEHVREQLPKWLSGGAVFLVAVEAVTVRDPYGVGDLECQRPVGFIGGLLLPHFMNPKIIQLAETFWWVQEEFRTTSAGARLFNAFCQEAKVLGVDWLTLSLEEHSPIKEESLTKRGFRRTERAYLLEMDHGSSDCSAGRLDGDRSRSGSGGRHSAATGSERSPSGI